MTQQVNKKWHSIRIWLLVLLFFGPFAFSWLLYLYRDLVNFHTLNKGTLIQPALELANLPVTDLANKNVDQKVFQGKWWMLYVNELPCDAQCKITLHNLRQVWMVLGKDRNRVNRAFLAFPAKDDGKFTAFLAKTYPELQRYQIKKPDLTNFLSGVIKTNEFNPTVFLMDLKGRIMLSYPATVAPKDILDDLKRLLSVSQIG